MPEQIPLRLVSRHTNGKLEADISPIRQAAQKMRATSEALRKFQDSQRRAWPKSSTDSTRKRIHQLQDDAIESFVEDERAMYIVAI
mmetsp:Transcript_31037/g.49943  ORF Transcript_31037/g.49943 Transcript_31037/m.49943 type:complete len:86 (+) Transcript_31037:55-312(+)